MTRSSLAAHRRGGPRGGRRATALVALWLAAACLAQPQDAPRIASPSPDPLLLTALGQRYLPTLRSAPGQSGFRLLVSGREAFAARAALAETAERSLDLQYYIVADDATATVLLEAALRAARRGVRVRLLVDDLNVGAREERLAALSGETNLEVRLFNPFAARGSFGMRRLLELLGDGERLNRRMHNKAWIADGAVAVVGGRNLSDAYFNVAPGTDFADLDVLAAGPVVADMAGSFDRYWTSALAVPIATTRGQAPDAGDMEGARRAMADEAAAFREGAYVRELRRTAFGAYVRSGDLALVVAPARVLSNVPAHPAPGAAAPRSEVFTALREAIGGARHDVILVSPYLVPGEQGRDVLCALSARGVRVRILTNSLASTDVAVVHAGYARYRPQLAACGVQLHELRPQGPRSAARAGLSSGARLHSKAVVVDGQAVFIGSMNLDPRSRELNTELALRIDSAELGRQVTELFDEAVAPAQAFRVVLDEPGNPGSQLHWEGVEDGAPVRYASEPLAGTWRRWLARLLGALAPEELL